MNITSTQIGQIAVNLVINSLIIESAGRLSPFQPVADDYGIDLLIYDKTTGRALPLQVKARTKTLKKSGCQDRGNTVHFEARAVALQNKGRTELLAILLNEEMTAITVMWLIPLLVFTDVASKRKGKFVIRPNRSLDSKDKFKQYQLPSMKALVAHLTTRFERFDRTFPAMSVLR